MCPVDMQYNTVQVYFKGRNSGKKTQSKPESVTLNFS